MKNKTYILAMFLVTFLALGGTARALTVDVNSGAKAETGESTTVNASAKLDADSNSDDSSEVKGNSTSSVAVLAGGEGDEHKSAVATVVARLLSISTRDGGIGADVRLVAQEQASTSAQLKTDMDELNSESKVKVFLFGPSYKNLGDLRSSITTTQNHIARLKKAEDKATSASVKADLEVQIKALQDLSVSTQAFVDAHANKLSVFGWFVSIFSK